MICAALFCSLMPNRLSDFKGQRRPLRFVVHIRIRHRCHVNHLDEPLARTSQPETGDAVRVRACAYLARHVPRALPPRQHILIRKRLPVERAENLNRLPDAQAVRILLWNDLDRVAERRAELVRARVADLKDGADVLGVAFAHVPVKLPVTPTLGERVGNAVMREVLIKVCGVKFNLSRQS